MKPTTVAATTSESQTVARPLRVLVPLIQDDLKQGHEAALRAGLPYYRAAGEKLLEAKLQLPHGEFTGWVRRNFTVSTRMAQHYMALAEEAATQNGNAFRFSSLKDFIRETTKPREKEPAPTGEPRPGAAPRVEANPPPRPADLPRTITELEAQRLVALQVVESGYRSLARQLHPDVGGSNEAMARLNAVCALMRTMFTTGNALTLAALSAGVDALSILRPTRKW